jgi:tetratricopeptide (TPR) repeat protein
MISRRRALAWALGFLLSAAFWPLAGMAFANVAVGDVLENPELSTLDGGKAAFLSTKHLANVFVFFRPNQDHSLETLKAMAKCEKEFATRPVHWVAVVSSSWDAEEVRAVVRESGITMPVLVDRDDQLYGRLGVRLHPAIGVANERLELLAYEPFHKINYCDRIRGKIRYALHEIDLAEVYRTEHPAKALFPNEIKGAVEHRHVRMGENYLHSKQYDRAVAEAKQILEKNPSYAPAHALLGDALAAQGNCGDAVKAWEVARKLDPNSGPGAEGKASTCAGAK